MSLYTPVQSETSAIGTQLVKLIAYKHVCGMQSRCAIFTNKQHCLCDSQSVWANRIQLCTAIIQVTVTLFLCFLSGMSLCCVNVILNASEGIQEI